MSDLKADRTLDCSGLRCPLPLVKTNKAIKEMQVGEVLEMISTDPDSELDIQAWGKQTQHEVLAAEKKDGGAFHFLIRKNH